MTHSGQITTMPQPMPFLQRVANCVTMPKVAAQLSSTAFISTVGAVVHERKGIDRVQRHLIEGADAVGDHGQNQILVLEYGAVVGVLVEEEDELLTGTETGFAAAEK